MQLPFALACPVKHYTWGSTDGISGITGIPDPENRPVAEFWMGAHPLSSSYVDVRALSGESVDYGVSKISLATLIERHPDEMLGPTASLRYGASLPFLFKILSAARPLSLQVHPNSEKARSGYARETATGIPPDSPERCYRDRNGKSELVMALTPFSCLCGFRAVSESLSLLSDIPGEAIATALACLNDTRDYRCFLTRILSLPDTDQRKIAHEARRIASSISDGSDPFSKVSFLCEHYPGDIGVLAPLYLNTITLSPGEALFLDSGILHTYLTGTAIELMSNSDNVLRGGLTAKKVNRTEFLDVLDPSPVEPRILVAEGLPPGPKHYRTSSPDFELSLFELSSSHVDIPTGVPSILLVTAGTVALACPDKPEWGKEAGKGSVYFVPATSPRIVASGNGTAYIASLPRPAGIDP